MKTIWATIVLASWIGLALWGASVSNAHGDDKQLVWHVNENTDVFITNFKCPLKTMNGKYPYVAYAVNNESRQILTACWRQDPADPETLFEIHWEGTEDTPQSNTHYYFDALMPTDKSPAKQKKPEPSKTPT